MFGLLARLSEVILLSGQALLHAHVPHEHAVGPDCVSSGMSSEQCHQEDVSCLAVCFHDVRCADTRRGQWTTNVLERSQSKSVDLGMCMRAEASSVTLYDAGCIILCRRGRHGLTISPLYSWGGDWMRLALFSILVQ